MPRRREAGPERSPPNTSRPGEVFAVGAERRVRRTAGLRVTA
ncbi:hypothetical protein ACGFSG_35540 [Streptomyces sp. NPDC048512]